MLIGTLICRANASITGRTRAICSFADTAFRDPKSYFHRYAMLNEAETETIAQGLWERINLVNLRENILPTRPRARLILRKGDNHRIEKVALRRV